MSHATHRWAVWGLMITLVAAAACRGATPEGAVPQPKFDGEEGAMTAAISGTLAGDGSVEGGCVWLVASDGEVASLQWAFPVFLRRSDMALVDREGAMLAEVGDRVDLVGGYATGESLERCMVGEQLIRVWTIRSSVEE